MVGGPVRDLLLGRISTDLDLVTEGDVEVLASRVAEAVGSKAVFHRRFGTATLKYERARLDLATARSETYARPGALPTVTVGTIEEDLQRRDFTINAMALGLTGRHAGRLLDPVGGLADVSRGVVRILRPQSFEDDATRIFRAIRYEQRLGFRLDPGTCQRLADALAAGMLATVSADRIRRELKLILEEDRAVQTLLRAGELGALWSLYAPLRQGRWLRASLDSQEEAEPVTLLAALAYPMSFEEGQGFIARLNMPSAWADAVTGMTQLVVDEPALEDPSLSPSMLYRTLEGRPTASICALMRLTEIPAVKQRLAHFLDSQRFVRPLLRGGDLVVLGVPQGPQVGAILRRIQDARLEGRVTTKEDEYALALRCLSDLKA
jgi:tRNA nucleotidyltransferase (CCA-adding enzyme)